MNKNSQKWLSVLFLFGGIFLLFSCKKDNTTPVITILGDNPYIYCIDLDLLPPYEDPGATALDDEDGDITSEINASSNVNIAIEGTYQVTYAVKDKAGNSSTATREVKVMYCKK
jgi:hypothetical protein